MEEDNNRAAVIDRKLCRPNLQFIHWCI